MNTLYQLIRADFLERARRYSFLVTLGLVLYLGYTVNAGQILLRLEQYRGVLNSAWVGSLMALTVNFFLGWFGFYLIKNAIARDYDTGVGQIMATTPLSRPLYTLGKWLSNFAVLLVMVVILALAGIAMQLIAREVPQFDLWALLAPLLFVALPMMALVAALAVLFETIAWLRGGFGNVVYFFIFPMLLVATMTLGKQVPALDVFGMQTFTASMRTVLIAVNPTYAGGATFGIVPAGTLKTFVWPGLAWTGAIIWPRLLIVGASAGLALLSAIFFDRFDPSRELRLGGPKARRAEPVEALEPSGLPTGAPAGSLSPLTHTAPPNAVTLFIRTLGSELRLMFKGVPWWWAVIALILIGGGLFSPVALTRQVWLPLAWLWPLLLWSALGSREARWQTGQMIFSAAAPLRRQLPALWVAGVSVTALTGLGAALRLVLAGQWAALLAWAAAVVFIPALALALGTWTNSNKAFEVIYLVLWYSGPLNGLTALDFMGARDAALGAHLPLFYLAAAAVLLMVAVAGRRRQIIA
jgi:hypothetical protein